jgi:hypothetical protein
VGRLLENVHFEDRGGDGTVISRWISEKYVLRMEGGLNWLRIMSIRGLWY